MKKALTIIVLLMLITHGMQAQTYSINKLNYHASDYFRDPSDLYNPYICGLASYFLPGLGQIIAGETGRGLAFMGGAVMAGLATGGTFLAFVVTESPQYLAPMLISLGSIVMIQIWSTADAINVAKVNNLYLRDKFRNTSMHLELSPYLSPVSSFSPAQSSAGMSVRLRF